MAFEKAEAVEGDWEHGYSAAHEHFKDLLKRAADDASRLEAENERLRVALSPSAIDAWAHIYDENARLETENEQLRTALKPLADIPLWRDRYPDAKDDWVSEMNAYRINVEQVRAARAALK